MFSVDDDIRKFVGQLTASSHSGSGAKLTPKSVNIALVALRAYCDRTAPRLATEAIASFQIEAFDGMDLPQEVLAITINERLAHTILAKAKKRFPGRIIVLRGKTSSGERIIPAD